MKYGKYDVLPNPLAPDLFTDEAMAFHIVEGVVRITLGSMRSSEGIPPSDMHLVVQGRLLMSVPTAQRLVLGLHDFLRKHGADPGLSSGAGEKAN